MHQKVEGFVTYNDLTAIECPGHGFNILSLGLSQVSIPGFIFLALC